MNKKKWWKLETQFHLKKFSVCSVIDQIIQSDTEKIMSFLREEFGWMDLYLKIIRHDWSDNVIWSLKWYFLINQLLVLGIFLRRYCSINWSTMLLVAYVSHWKLAISRDEGILNGTSILEEFFRIFELSKFSDLLFNRQNF